MLLPLPSPPPVLCHSTLLLRKLLLPSDLFRGRDLEKRLIRRRECHVLLRSASMLWNGWRLQRGLRRSLPRSRLQMTNSLQAAAQQRRNDQRRSKATRIRRSASCGEFCAESGCLSSRN